ncbi:MAG: tRNA (adenosine(37)-N6)-threonylcarbamoyltransferase complex ATPase subunit type 1 TsaE [Dysgonamonadaceae bacterium]|jgi:tRNA threonylcarbamoyladenosine biosynthesis protein TsaE|nr:tRNA (adenosine(37)-N6)-threonylcarbamoyltransferase complex ATPase subunit type 1 TsaE [Dysgonamonadaceae bacterium]
MLVEDLRKINEAAREFIRLTVNGRVFAFSGAMGAGKTTFIKAVCEELGVKDVINSPTFAIVNEYYSETLHEPVYHFDLYRIENTEDALRTGIDDYFNSGCLCFIEWAEKIEALLPENTVFVEIKELVNGSRKLRIK